MLSFLLLSAATLAGASMVVMDWGDDDDDIDSPNDAPENDMQAPDAPSLLNTIETSGMSSNPETDTTHVTQSDARFEGTDAAETVSIDTDVQSGSVEYVTGDVDFIADDADDIAIVDTGAGDDVITITGGVADITTGDGADTVDASGMAGGVIRAGSGDVIAGSDVAPDPNDFYATTSLGVSIQDDAIFTGGAANEYIATHGDGATVDGGAGNDVLLNFGGAATLSGGEGDDLIDAHAFRDEYDQSTGSPTRTGDGNPDLVDGGTGNDRIFVDGGDTVTGGSGADTINAAFQLGAQSAPVTVTDFDTQDDIFTLSLTDYLALDDGAGGVSFDPSSRISILEGDGDSHVFVDDELVAVLENTAGLTADGTYIPEDPENSWHGLRIQIS